jgi:uncharacterized repeat protein (TIGR01451 family)
MTKILTLCAACAALLLLAAPASAGAATADLGVEMTDGADPVTVGAALDYSLTVTNGGPDTANGVELVDTLPGQVDFVSSKPSQGSCKGSKKITCTLGTIANGGSATLAIQVKPKKAGQIVNSATVSAVETDPLSANNTDTETTTVVEPPPPPTCAGEQATIVGTEGDDQLTGTKKKDVFVALGGNDAIYGLEGDDLICAFGGDDLLKGGNGNDALRGGGGADHLGGGAGADALRGGGGPDTCKGGPGPDTKQSC